MLEPKDLHQRPRPSTTFNSKNAKTCTMPKIREGKFASADIGHKERLTACKHNSGTTRPLSKLILTWEAIQ